MRNCDPFMKRHLKINVYLDHELVHDQNICDPFIQNRNEFVTEFSLWDRLKILFTGVWKWNVSVHVKGDTVAIKRWFSGVDCCERCARTISGPGSNADNPGYHHGDERLCESCYYNIPDEGVEEMTVGLHANDENVAKQGNK